MTNPLDLMTISMDTAQHSTAMMTLIYSGGVLIGVGVLYAVIVTAVRDALRGLQRGARVMREKGSEEDRVPALRAVS